MRTNFLALGTGQIATWTLQLVTLTLLVRHLGPEGIGQFHTGSQFGLLALGLGALGIPTAFVKKIARDSDTIARLFPTALSLALLLGSIAGAIGTAMAVTLGYSRETQIAVIASCAGVPFALMVSFAFAAFQGLERMRYRAVWAVAERVLMLLLVVGVIVADLGLVAVVLAYLGLGLLMPIPVLVTLHRMVPYRPFMFSPRLAASLIRSGLPYFAAGIFVMIYTATDILLLSLLADDSAVGIYSAPVRIFSMILFIPSIVSTVALPRMSALQRESPAQFQNLVGDILRLVVTIAIPISILSIGLSDALLLGALGDGFSQSRPVIFVMAATVAPTSLLIVTHIALIAADRQMVWAGVMSLGLVVKIGLSLLLIPLFAGWLDNAALGAAVSLLAIEGALTLGAVWLLPQGLLDRHLAVFFGKVVGAAAVAVLVAVACMPIGALVAAIAGGTAYLMCVLLLRTYGLNEVSRWIELLLGPRFGVLRARLKRTPAASGSVASSLPSARP